MSAISSSLYKQQKEEVRKLLGLANLALLYKASVHGYTANAFHQRCDRQGPTITVAYNRLGFVFGGYTSINYAQTFKSVLDDKAFLFSVHDKKIVRVPAMNPQFAFIDGDSGPSFMGDLVFLYQNRATVYSNPGKYYNFNAAEMHGNDLQLTDCEVYRVEAPSDHELLDNPWRTISWGSKRREALIDFIKYYKPIINTVNQAKILLIGPTGAGKSSFFNSINSIFWGHVTCRALCGSAGSSLTTQFRTYSIKIGKRGNPLPIILCDTMGLEETPGAGLNVDDITSIVNGHVPDRYQFNTSSPLQSDAHEFRKSVPLRERVHCVVYVIESCKATLMSTKLEEKLLAIRKEMNQMGVPQLVLLTKVEEACPSVAGDVRNVYLSPNVENKIREVSAHLGIPVSCVVPVKNYCCELELEESCDILLLGALLQMLRFADTRFDDVGSQA